MTPEDALAAIAAHADPERAKGAAAYHKADRTYLGVANPVLNDLTQGWRQSLSLDDRLSVAEGLWQTDIFEARVAAAKLLTQARIRPDDAVWDLICRWVPDFDSWAIADHVCMAGQKRILADPSRVETVAEWTKSDHLWTKRAALVITLPYTKMNNPKDADLAIRETVLGWCVALTEDRTWFMQKAIAWWLRDLSKHDPDRTRAFLDEHGERLKGFARKEAAKYL